MAWLDSSHTKPQWANNEDEILYALTVREVVEIYRGLVDSSHPDSPSLDWTELDQSTRDRIIGAAREGIREFMTMPYNSWFEEFQDAVWSGLDKSQTTRPT